MDEREVLAVPDGSAHYRHYIIPEPYLTPREIDPVELVGSLEKGLNLIEGQLILKAFFPDVAGLASVVALICQNKGELVGKVEPLEV
jgi:hypothetical protein